LLKDNVNIVVDIDNTIADTQGALGHRFGTTANHYPWSVVPEGFFESEEGINLLCSAEPFPGAAGALRTLASRRCYITYVTIRPGSGTMAFGTECWLRNNGFPVDGGIVFCGASHAKTSLVEVLRPAVVFEDDPAIAATLAREVPFVLVKNWPYNRYLFPGDTPPKLGLVRFDDWDECFR
jgi:hypothetical protein